MLIGICLLLVTAAQAQDRLQFSAGKLSGSTINGVKYNIFESSPSRRVIITQGKTKVYCNKAVENATTKDVTATGNVQVVQEGMKINGETMYYYKTTGKVIILPKEGGEVKMTQNDMTLTTDKLYYDMKTGNAYYLTGGHVVQKELDLTSDRGYMYRNSNIIAFKRRVVMKDSVKNQTIETDTMAYDTQTKIATFPVTTFIKSKDGYVLAKKGGKANTATSEVFFIGETTSQTVDYALDANNLYLNDSTGEGIARDDVRLKIKKERINIYGDVMEYGNEMTRTKAHGHAYMEMPLSAGDTLFLTADTLFSVTDTAENRMMFAYNNVQIYSRQMQGTCDSLVYNLADSMIYFFNDPVLWSKGSQITGNEISAKLEEDDIDRMFIDSESFIISRDSIGNFNQIKGKEMVAHFDQGYIRKVDVEGNGETIFYALEGDSLLIGMNYITCSSMVIYFADSNKINDISFITKPESKFIPPHELTDEDQALDSFNPRFDKTPGYGLVTRLRNKMDAITEEESEESPETPSSSPKTKQE